MSEAHHEKPFENYVIDRLAAQGWLLGDTSGYDKDRAIGELRREIRMSPGSTSVQFSR